ncbi:hypothetical protein AAVH_14450 [Aphelenchoides avenae]|nr:hypothetical protein AAVH_14450 [Aphelenchus avenae]
MSLTDWTAPKSRGSRPGNRNLRDKLLDPHSLCIYKTEKTSSLFAGRVDGFNSSTTRACISGGGLEEPHCLVNLNLFGDYNEYASPHSVDGRHFAVEFQLLHRSNRGTMVMLVIFGGIHFDSCWWADGCTKESLVPLISALETAKKTHAPARIEALSPSSFLPSDTRPFYMYVGNVIGDCGTAAKYFLLKERVKLPDALMNKLRWSLGTRSSPKVQQQAAAGQVYSRWFPRQ